MRAEAFERVIETAAQMFVKRLLGAGFVLELHRLVENAPVAGLLEVSGDAEDEPVRVVVEIRCRCRCSRVWSAVDIGGTRRRF